MSEQSHSPEKIPVTEEEVLAALDSRGIEDRGTEDLLVKYAEQCQAEADTKAAADPENPEVSNRANIECAIKLAVLYSKTKNYKEQAIESLEDALVAASQNDLTKDLADQITALIDEIERP